MDADLTSELIFPPTASGAPPSAPLPPAPKPVALPVETTAAVSAPSGTLKDIIDQAAAKHGVDPRIMYGIHAGESAHGSHYDSKDDAVESSWGPFQLNRRKGLGVEFERQTGLDVRDPSSIPAQTEWVAKYIAAHGMPGVTGNWFGYHGNKDWDPKWGNAGFGGKAGPVPLFHEDQLLPSYQSQNAPRDYRFTDAMRGALRHETALGILYEHATSPNFASEPFTWSPDLQKEKLGDLDANTQEYIRSTAVSLGHVDYLRNEALDRLDSEKAIASQGLLGGSAAVLGAGLVDIPSWVAGGYAAKVMQGAKTAGALTRIGQSALVAGASDIPLEAAKINLEPGYSYGDAVRGAATATLFGGGLSALGEIGGAYASRFRKLQADPDSLSVGSPARPPEAQTATDAGAGLSAEVAAPIAPVIEPTAMDKFAKKLGGWADFSVGGSLYHSKNDAISELAPKLATIASEDLTTNGVRSEEAALDFVRRRQAANDSAVHSALEKWYKPWADAQGFNAWDRATKVDEFYDLASSVHTDPGLNLRDVDPNVAGFVGDMRELFANELELGKAYGVERMETLDRNDFYLPRYFDKEQWRAHRQEFGQEGLESIVEQALKTGDPELAQRVGTRVVTRAAENEAKKATTASGLREQVTQEAQARRAQEIAQAVSEAKDANEAVEGLAKIISQDLTAQVKGEAKQKVSQKRLGGPQTSESLPSTDTSGTISLDSVRASVAQEVEHWRGVEQELRDEANRLPKAAKAARDRLRKEADEIKDFHNKLLAEAEGAWAEAESRYLYKPAKMAQAEARIERDARLASLDKKTQKTVRDEQSSIRQQRDERIQGAKDRAKELVQDRMQAIQARFFQEAFAKRMAKFEDKFVRRVARKYVETVNNSIEGIRADVDRALTVRDTELLREALKREGVVVDADIADALADMIAPRAQRGPTNLRKRTTLDENTPFLPNGGARAISLRDLMVKDYEQIVGRYTRSMSPHYIMAKHGFQTESVARKYVADSVSQFKGIDGYKDTDAFRDKRKADYLLDHIYGKDPMRDVDPKWRAISQIVSNLSYARIGGSFGMAQTYDAAELVLRHGFEAFQRGAPSMKQIAATIKQGGPEAAAIVRDLQVFAGVGVKGQEARIVPKFRGLDSELADSGAGTRLVKMMRLSKGLANAVGHASGLNVLTDVQHMAAARIFLQTVADVARGTRNVDRRLLADMGLDQASLKKFWGVLQHAKFDKEGVLEDLNASMLRTIDLKAFDELMGATRREAFRTILEPNPGLLPMWAGNSPVGKMFAQLKTFSMAANATHSVGNWRLGPAYVAKSVVGGAAWAFAMYSLWAHVKSLGKSEDERGDYLEKAFAPDKLAFNVWSRVGMAGITPEVLGGGLAVGQKLGVLPEDEGNHYGQSARASGLIYGAPQSVPVLSMLGTVLDSLQTGVDVTKTKRGMTRGEARRMMSLLPLQNALGISQAINAATTNLPEKKEQ